MDNVKYGDAFLMAVTEGTLGGTIETEDLGLVHRSENERRLVDYVKGEVQHYGGAQQLYVCVPIGRVWTDDPGDENDSTDAPNRVVNVELAETQIERMARAAMAMGV